MSTPPAPAMVWCHGLDCTWSGTSDELVRGDTSKPPACPRCGSGEKLNLAGVPPGSAPAALADAAARIDLATSAAARVATTAKDAAGVEPVEPDGVKVDSVVEEYEAAVRGLWHAQKALTAAQQRAQAALVALNQGILGRAGLE